MRKPGLTRGRALIAGGRGVRRAVVLAAAVLTVTLGIGTGRAVHAQTHVYDFVRSVIDITTVADDFTCATRPQDALTFRWGGHEYVMVNAGTDAVIYDSVNPGSKVDSGGFGLGFNCTPGYMSATSLSATPTGDATTQAQTAILNSNGITALQVCDECRYGAVYGTTSYVFDLGAPSSSGKPSFVNAWSYTGAAFLGTYSDADGTQYLVARGKELPQSCGPSARPAPGVYRIVPPVSGSGQPGLQLVVCLSDTGLIDPMTVTARSGLLFFQNSNQVEVAGISGNGAPTLLAGPVTATGFDPLAVDLDRFPARAGYLLTTLYTPGSAAAKLYRLTGTTSAVTLKPVLDIADDHALSFAALTVDADGRSGYAFLTTYGSAAAGYRRMFALSNLDGTPAYQSVDEAYWNDPQADFNQTKVYGHYIADTGGTFTRGGEGLWFARYYQMAYFSYQGPAEPTPALSLNPPQPYPGDSITVRNDSSNWTAARLWVTDATGAIVADSGWGSYPSPPTLSWDSPTAFACSSTAFTAHVQVESANGPQFDYGVPFDCSPGVTLNLSAENLLINETENLQAVVDGGLPTGYSWSGTDPGGNPLTITNDTDTYGLVLDQEGTWSFGVTANYAHTVSGTAWAATATPRQVTVASVVPAVAISPTDPKPNTSFTLSAAGSRIAAGITATYAYSIDASAAPICSGDVPTVQTAGAATIPDCVVVGGVAAGDHTAHLTMTPTGGSPVVADVPFTASLQTITVIASTYAAAPGQTVHFTASSSTGDAIVGWDLGGASCDSTGSRLTCGSFACPQVDWAYAAAGSYTVKAFIASGASGQTSTPVVVSGAGSCQSSCTYTVSANPSSFNSSGGSGTLTVSTQSGCAWTASKNQSWVTFTGSYSGTGPGSVGFNVGSSSVTTTRYATFTAGDQYGSDSDTISQAGSSTTGGANFTYSPTSPKTGEPVTFTVTEGTVSAWDFGGTDCAGNSSKVNCPSAALCNPFQWTYATTGSKTVTLYTTTGSKSYTFTVGTGTGCGSTSCSYAISPTSRSVGADATTGQVTVSCGATCSWSATSDKSWLTVTSPSGSATGPGTLQYSVAANPDEVVRTGKITVVGKTFVVNQAAAEPAPTPTSLVVPAAAYVKGNQNTSWQSDLRVFNSSSSAVTIHLQLLPPAGDSTTYDPVSEVISAHATLWIPNVIDLVAPGSNGQGAVEITYEGPVPPSVVSRTFTSDPTGETLGTYGQQIPASFDTSLAQQGDVLFLPGLEHDDAFRTNIGLVNSGDANAIFDLTFYPEAGGDPYERTIPLAGKHSVQLSLPTILGVDSALALKGSLQIDVTGGTGATAYGSVVDQISGDPIFVQAIKQQ